MMTEQELHRNLSVIPREELLRMLSTEINVDPDHTMKLKDALARSCMRVAHDSRFTREAQAAALRSAKGFLAVPDPDEEDNEVETQS